MSFVDPHAHLHHHGHHHHLTYHHVKIDGTGTKFYGSVEQYEHAVQRQLQRVHHTRTGQAVFHEFNWRTTKHLKVIPYEEVELNAYAQATNLRTATAKGQVERSGRDGTVLLDLMGKPMLGTGKGSDSDVSYTPGIWTKYCNQNKGGHRSGAQLDEILFHEMVHATRQMRGILDPLPLGFNFDTEEEFFAIVLANIYASETDRPIDIRADHHGFDPLFADTNETFLPKKDPGDYRYRLVEKLVHQERRMAHELNRVHADFNPIRRYYELQRTHAHFSRH